MPASSGNKNRYHAIRLVIELTRTMDQLDDLLAGHFARFNLSQPKFNALMELRLAGDAGLPLSELGQRMLVSRANITGLVDRLERDGLVTREADSADRRIIRARITPRAQELLTFMLPLHNELVYRAMSFLTDDEQQVMLGLLLKLQQGWQGL
ncbi:MarR family winged helix-turn-helix transcriptional regulator [Desulfotomaculum copahuensis]|uniref:MarR family transcriptional regulator n=1 Tax=Desulfotomaculum copahuensis TaxID=1838280 RepID=A0A1B7LE92_9FIRM|nr:MarR family transcriptional regulator [Desulfotomaculum copahuensis]OAT81422.1 MarR family transcriptional regulator [Desulfotomaculum copahuensis]